MRQYTIRLFLSLVVSSFCCFIAAAQSVSPIAPTWCLNPAQIREYREQALPILQGSDPDFIAAVAIKRMYLELNWYLNSAQHRLDICEKKYAAETPREHDCANEKGNVIALEQKLKPFLEKKGAKFDLDSPSVDEAIEKLRDVRKNFPLCSL